jgi:hypothetical protein
MLSSNRDGEVIAAARAITRTLKRGGADIHTLAEAIGDGSLNEVEMKTIYDAGYAAGMQAIEDKLHANGFHDIGDENNELLATMARYCWMNSERLRNDTERNFIRGVERRTRRGQRISEKQESWLRDCYARVHQ